MWSRCFTDQSGSRQQELIIQLVNRCWQCRSACGPGGRWTQQLLPPLQGESHSRLLLPLQLQKLHHLLWGWQARSLLPLLWLVQSMRSEDILYGSNFVQDIHLENQVFWGQTCYFGLCLRVYIVVMKYHNQKASLERMGSFGLYFHNAVYHQTQTGERPGSHGGMLLAALFYMPCSACFRIKSQDGKPRDSTYLGPPYHLYLRKCLTIRSYVGQFLRWL